MRPPPMLVQVSKLYTHVIFEAFQGEFDVGAGQQQCATQIHRHGKYAHYTAPSTYDKL